MRTVEEHASRRGRRLDLAQAKRAVFAPTANLLVDTREGEAANAYVGLLIDSSGSMDGEKIEIAKAFGVLVAEAVRGLPGLAGHVSAFDDDTFYPLGDFNRCAVASLESGGGNNDAGGLAKAADLALKSGKRNKLLLMVSDGSPTMCTVESLRKLVAKLTREHGIACVQIAVESIDHEAFPPTWWT